MPNIRPIEFEEAKGPIKELYDVMVTVDVQGRNILKLLGYSPEMLGPAISLAKFAGSNRSLVSTRLKQLAYLMTSCLNKCQYSIEHQATAAMSAGWSLEPVESIVRQDRDLLENPAFNHLEKLVIRYTQEMTLTATASYSTVKALKEVLNDEEFLEITFVIATANMFNRLANGLNVDLEPEFYGR